MKSRANAISASSQSVGVEGWLYESVDGKQMAYWVYRHPISSSEHVHDFNEYFVVIQGEYTLLFGNGEVIVSQGEEYHIPKGVPHAGRAKAHTRTIHCFDGKRAEISK
jgi:quercetin dioxygenase-like cupin family protein